jgi:hypothetical protein
MRELNHVYGDMDEIQYHADNALVAHTGNTKERRVLKRHRALLCAVRLLSADGNREGRALLVYFVDAVRERASL